jgi:hypothetical protein
VGINGDRKGRRDVHAAREPRNAPGLVLDAVERKSGTKGAATELVRLRATLRGAPLPGASLRSEARRAASASAATRVSLAATAVVPKATNVRRCVAQSGAAPESSGGSTWSRSARSTFSHGARGSVRSHHIAGNGRAMACGPSDGNRATRRREPQYDGASSGASNGAPAWVVSRGVAGHSLLGGALASASTGELFQACRRHGSIEREEVRDGRSVCVGYDVRGGQLVACWWCEDDTLREVVMEVETSGGTEQQGAGEAAAVPQRMTGAWLRAEEVAVATAQRAVEAAAAQRAVDEAAALEARAEAKLAAEWRAADEAAAAAARAIAAEVIAAARCAQEAASVAGAQRVVDETAAAEARYAAEAAAAQRALDEAAASAARAAAAAAKREEADSAARCTANEAASAAALAQMSAAAAAVERDERSRTPQLASASADSQRLHISPGDFFTFSAPQDLPPRPSSRAPLSGAAIVAQHTRDEAAAVAAQHHLAESAAIAAKRRTETAAIASKRANAVRKPQAQAQRPSVTNDNLTSPYGTTQPAPSVMKKLSPSKAANLAMRQALAAAATPLEAAQVVSRHAASKAAAAEQRHEQLLERQRIAKQWPYGRGAALQWSEDLRASEEEVVRLRCAAAEAASAVAVMVGAQADTSKVAKPPSPHNNTAAAAASRSTPQRLPSDSPPSESDDDLERWGARSWSSDDEERWGARPWSSDDDTFDRDRSDCDTDARCCAALLLQCQWRVLKYRLRRRAGEAAATRLQSAWRGCVSVRTARRLRSQRATSEAHSWAVARREVAATQLQSGWRRWVCTRLGQRLRLAANEVAVSAGRAVEEVAAQLIGEASKDAAMRLIMGLAVEATHFPRCSGGRQRRKQRARRQQREAARRKQMARAVDCSGLGAVDCQGGAVVGSGGCRLSAHTAP